jgi:Ni/Co efflux regulator RcnB
MKFRPLVAAIAAGSLLLGNVAAFGQAEEAQRRQQEEQQARERGHPLPTDPSSPSYGHPGRMQRELDRAHGDDRAYYRDSREDRRYDPRYYQRWDQDQRRYVPSDRNRSDWHGRGAGPEHDWYRGGYLPREYRGRNYVVDDWRNHHLYAPPAGYHWVQAPGGDYVLAAIATGLIAAILLNQ